MHECVFKMHALWKFSRFIIHLADAVRVFSAIIYKDLYILMPPTGSFLYYSSTLALAFMSHLPGCSFLMTFQVKVKIGIYKV